MRPLVACLCAEWCGSCREYRAAFDAFPERYGERADFTWIDVEDESDALGDPDIENFPTLLIAQGDALRFLGVLTPQPETLERMLRAAEARNLPPPVHELDAGELSELLAGVRRLG